MLQKRIWFLLRWNICRKTYIFLLSKNESFVEGRKWVTETLPWMRVDGMLSTLLHRVVRIIIATLKLHFIL